MTKEEFEKLKPGDKVRIVRMRVFGMNRMGEMDKWLGKVMTVRERTGNIICMVEDQHEYCGGWYWGKDMIECKTSEAENTICILTRGGKTIAKRGKKVGIAKCSTADEYDEAKGAIIAVARLYGYGVVSDETGKVVLANEERRRIEKVAKSAAKKELRRIYRTNPPDSAIDKLAEGVFGKPLKETAKERVCKELAELEEKIEKLSHALAPLADKIGTETEEYNLLIRIRIYAEKLKRRLAIWKD